VRRLVVVVLCGLGCAPLQSESARLAPIGAAPLRLATDEVAQFPSSSSSSSSASEQSLYQNAACQGPDCAASSSALSGSVEADPDPGVETIDDEVEGDVGAARGAAPKHPLLDLTDDELAERLRADPTSLGPLSIGYTNAGVLVSGVQMP
jgi:hypothetical protein